MKRAFFVFFLAVMISGVGATPARAGERVVVFLDWFVNPDHGPLLIALEKGFFKARGLDIRDQPSL